ncbi:hypothetical protein N7494_012090 [Penicillium frequentans]|uniref:Serine hydrolase domain-containing protein n=1 Tax=Penicillium frequentans TaxID=3151616 RepID=A0AAD6GBE4_9EURO|nr:hypothetical protein N7494_012090 [Penicillium glabrum]
MSLPRIACFHGGGSNAKIHMVQCQNLQRELQHEFEFVYFEAPFTRGPGPGVLPAFKSYGPYKTWFTGIEDTSGFDDSTGEDGIERVWNMMIAETQKSGEQWNWVGALGFSQGTRVVSGLLLDQQRHKSQQDLAMSNGISGIGSLIFGVLCMGSGAPMQPKAGSALGTSYNQYEQISSPTIHVHGLKDMHLTGGRKQLATWFTDNSFIQWDMDYHHAMPWYKKDVVQLAGIIRDTYRSSLSH